MRILHTADWQVGALPGLPGSLERQNAGLEELLEIARRERVDAVVVVGDVFEHGRPVATVKDLVIRAVNEADLAGIRMVFLPGNHDYEDRAMSAYHPLMTLKVLRDRFMHVDVWDEPTVVEYPTFVLVAIPPAFTTEEGLDPISWPNQRLLQTEKPIVLALHVCFKGSRFVNGELAKNGLSPALLRKTPATYVALGDIHKRQQVPTGPGGPLAYYCGSLYPHDFGERAEDSGVLLVEGDAKGVTVRPIQLVRTPVLYSCGARVSTLSRVLDEIPANSVTRLAISGSPEELRTVDTAALRSNALQRGVRLLVDRKIEAAQVNLDTPDAGTVAEAVSVAPEVDLQNFIREGSFPVQVDALTVECVAVLAQCRAELPASAALTGGTISLLELRAENLLSLGEVKVPLANQGLVLVVGVNKDTGGTNGSGKSSTFDGVEVGIYQEARGVKTDALVNKVRPGGMLVELDYDIAGHPYCNRVSRDHTEHGTGFALLDMTASPPRNLVKKEKVVEGTPKRTTGAKEVLALLGVDETLFHGAVYLTQDQEHGFVYGTNGERQTFFAELFGFNLWRLCQERTRLDLAALREELKSVTDGIAQLRSQSAADMAEDLAILNAELEAAIQRRGDLDADVADLDNQSRSAGARLSTKETELGRLREVRHQALRAQEIAQSLEQVRQELEEARAQIPEWVKRDEAAFQTQRKDILDTVAMHNARLRDLEGLLQTLLSSHTATCPTCKQVIPPEYVASLQADRDQTLKIRAGWLLRRDNGDEVVKTLQRCAQLQQRLDSTHIPAATDVSEELVQGLENEVAALRAQRDSALQRHTELRRELSDVAAQCARLEQRVLTAQAATKRGEARTERLGVLTVREREITSRQDLLLYAERDVFPGLRIQKIRSLLHVLNREMQAYLDLLVPEGRVKACFEFRVRGSREELDLWVEDGPKGRLPIRNYSGGERKRVVIAVMFAVWKLATAVARAFNVVIFDEILKDVDTLGHRQVIELLRSVRDAGRTVLVSTNLDPSVFNLEDFDAVWVAVKEQDITRLVMLNDSSELAAIRAV